MGHLWDILLDLMGLWVFLVLWDFNGIFFGSYGILFDFTGFHGISWEIYGYLVVNSMNFTMDISWDIVGL